MIRFLAEARHVAGRSDWNSPVAGRFRREFIRLPLLDFAQSATGPFKFGEIERAFGDIQMCRAFLAVWLSVALALPSRADTNWPQFRGPSGGIAEDREIPDEWSSTKNVVWKADVPGRGWSSPVVWGRRIFLTTVLKDGEFESPKKGLYFGGERPKPSPDIHHWIVLSLDWDTGKQLWQREVDKGPTASTVHVKNTYASETPVTDGKRVYA